MPASTDQALSPTLWRTCRVLANEQRLHLLAYLHAHPDQAVSHIASALKMPVPLTSLYLRSLNARGLLRAERQGRWVSYRIGPDPQVPSSGRIVSAIKPYLTGTPAGQRYIFRHATAFTHFRRIEIVRELKKEPLSTANLRRRLGTSPDAVVRHMNKLIARGYVSRRDSQYTLIPQREPLPRTLLRLALAKD